MINRIEILSSGKSCWKTKKMISQIKKFVDSKDVDVEIVVISELKKILNYKTWILPTIIINGEIIARGYKPNNKIIIENLRK